MELIAPLSEKDDVAQRSYDFFHIISLAYSQEKKWEASRLVMLGAYQWGNFLPWVEGPRDILTFLDHHFDLATRGGQNRDEPIQNALRALAYGSGAVTIEALSHLDPTEPPLVRGIGYTFQDNKSFQLRKVATLFLPLAVIICSTSPIGCWRQQMKNPCAGWASTVDSIGHTDPVKEVVLTVLLGMIDSTRWCPHIVPEKWK